MINVLHEYRLALACSITEFTQNTKLMLTSIIPGSREYHTHNYPWGIVFDVNVEFYFYIYASPGIMPEIH